MMPDISPPLPFPSAAPPARPVARAQDRKTLLWRLRARRLELVDDLALGLGLDEPLSPSIVAPLATLQAAIAAVEAELATEQWDADPDKFNTEATPPGQDGDIGRD